MKIDSLINLIIILYNKVIQDNLRDHIDDARSEDSDFQASTLQHYLAIFLNILMRNCI